MSKKLDPNEMVTFEDLLMSNTIEQEAIVNLLVKKGLITEQELLEELKIVKESQHYPNIK